MASHRDIEPITRARDGILRLLAKGKSMQEMAAEKGIGKKTVDTQCGHPRAEFGIHSTVGHVVQAVLTRLLDL